MANSAKVLDNFKRSDFEEFWSYTASLNATGVIAGTPGSFTGSGPGDPELPANITALRADAEIGTVAYAGTPAWTVGQYVVLANAAEVYWNGVAWTTGRAPA